MLAPEFPSVMFYESYPKKEAAEYFTDIFFTRELLLHNPTVRKKVVELAKKDSDDETDARITDFYFGEKEIGHYVEFFGAQKPEDIVKRTYIRNPKTLASLLLQERKNSTYILELTHNDQLYVLDTAQDIYIPEEIRAPSLHILRSTLLGR